jgi:hypothetical protein
MNNRGIYSFVRGENSHTFVPVKKAENLQLGEITAFFIMFPKNKLKSTTYA